MTKPLWKAGDRIVVAHCDMPENQEILGLILVVLKDSQTHSGPFWTEVTRGGNWYIVRGSEARRATDNE